MECKQCGGETYDNRAKNAQRVADGQKPMPDFACKDKSCGWVQWPPRDKKTGYTKTDAPAGNGATPTARAPKRVLSADEEKALWKQAYEDYKAAFAICKAVIGSAPGLSGDYVNAIAQAATGMCIRREKQRENPPPLPITTGDQPAPFPLAPAAPPAAPPANRQRVAVAPPKANEFDDFPPELEDGDDGLPF